MAPNLSQRKGKDSNKLRKEKSRENIEKGREFEDGVASLYHLMGYTVQQNIEICQKKVDILASFELPGNQQKHRVIVECKDEKKNIAQNQRVMQFKGLLVQARMVGQADSAEIITRKPWSDKAKGFAAESGIGLYTFEEKLSKIIDFSNYIKRVIYDYEHFTEYVGNGHILKNPIIEIINRTDLHKTYVPLLCRVLEHQEIIDHRPLDEYVEKWLDDPYHNHLSILGDYGTGKSSFCLYLTYKLAKKYDEDPINVRIPLFISLRDYAKSVNLQQLITDLLLNKYNIRIENYAVFQRFLESGRLVLIFDGFDEMATKTDRALTIRNFEELTRVVVAGSKTILTCRTHYFTDQKQVDDIMRSGEGSELFQIIRSRPNFQIVQLEEFTDEQIQQLIRFHQPIHWNDAWVVIRRNLHDLARRPLLLDMIIQTLPKLLAMEKVVNTVHLYNEYTRIWIEREDWRAKMPPQLKKTFMEDLSLNMWISETQSMHYLDLREWIRKYFPAIVTIEDLDYFDHDTRTCSFLSRDLVGNYKFIHKSFMEFFVAKRIYDCLITNNIDPTFREKEFSPEISSFVAQFVSENMYALNNICHWAFDDTKTLSWNAISVLPFMKVYKPEQVVDNLLQLCEENETWRSGVIWVLGELGISNKKVLGLLKDLVCDPNKPDRWWEAAFALEKLGAFSDPVGELIKNLPPKWTFDTSLSNLRKVIESSGEGSSLVDQRDIVAVVREYRNCPLKEEIEKSVINVFNSLSLHSDTTGRRSYYAVWLFGELRILSALPILLSAVDHPQSAVRNMLAEAIGKIGEVKGTNDNSIDKAGLIVLTKLLHDHYYRARLHAAEAIGKVHAISLLPDLKDSLECESLWDVQNEMIDAIQLLENCH